MKKLFTFLILLALAIPAWAGEQTITISRNDGQFNSANGVYYCTKGGVTMEMSGGMNNINFLVLRHTNTVTFRSANFPIKKIVFHCLDDFTSDNLTPFYWGPSTMNVMTVNYKPVGSSTTTAVTPGKFTASGYDGTWTSSFSGTWTSEFRPSNGSGTETRTHTSFPNGWPAGNTLTFGSLGKPVRFSSIDIIVEKEDGDIYDLVTSANQVVNNHNYLIVNWDNAKALSVNTKEGRKSEQVRTGSPVEFISGHVDDSGNYDQYAKVKTDGEAQIIKFEKQSLPISNSNGQINNDRPWLLNAGGNYLRITSEAATGTTGNNGPDLYGISTINDEWSYAKVEIGGQTYGYNARIRFRSLSSTSYPRPTSTGYRVAYNKTNNYFRDLDYEVVDGGLTEETRNKQNIRLYTPAQNYNVTTEVQPDASKGTIALRDGVIVNDASATSGTSQQYETVSFIVNAADGYKIANITIQALNVDGTVASTIEPQSSTVTTNGTLYSFVMPGNDVNIVVEFEAVTYHNVNIVVKPNVACGNVFLTEGYVVQNDQVKSYDGQTVVFNVTPNLIDILNESEGYYELSYVSVTDNVTGEETILAPDAQNYTFTMPDNEVTITAYFYDNVTTPLYLLGTANGRTEWHTYGPRFNYDSDETSEHYGEYYIDVYFKGIGDFESQTGNNWGEFRVTWKVDPDDNWNNIKNQGKQGHPYKLSVDPFTNELVCKNGGTYRLSNGDTYGLNYDYGMTEYDGNWTDQEDYKFTVDPGIYRIYVGTTESGNAGHLGLNVLKVVKRPITLTLDPMGGETTSTALQVLQGQEVILAGDLYNKIKAIEPTEADANFYYKAVKNGTAENPVQSTTTASTTLSEVNAGETVTELRGYNYLGWIVAGDTAFYKVKETPLKWIEEEGTPGNKYIVADELIIMHKIDRAGQRLLWAKDQSDDPLHFWEQGHTTHKDATFKTTEQIDYLVNTYNAQAVDEGWSGWDQSNWVMLRFDENTDMSQYHIYQTIKEGTLVGTYVDKSNFCINVESMQTGDNVGYVPNTFCPANFLDFNLNLNGQEGGAVAQNSGKKFFFMNPKVQEVADVTLAVWDKPNSRFIMPSGTGVNQANISGYFTINCLYNSNGDVTNDLQNGAMYAFRGVLNVAPGGSNASLRDGDEPEAPTGPDTTKMVMPFDLKDSPITAINDVEGSKTVSSVKYYNITGIESDKPFSGVNIVVTRYTDGSFSTTKVLR